MSKDKKNVEYIIYLIFYEKEFNVSVIYIYAYAHILFFVNLLYLFNNV